MERFTIGVLVAWPLYESEAGVDLVLIETSAFRMYNPINSVA